ncbi:MAG: hypothetical protein ACRD8U_06400, partial [Pyrinomonadaceae bacterium]
FISIEELEQLTKGMARSEAYRLIAALVKHHVENLRDNRNDKFDAKSLRKRLKAERRGLVAEQEEAAVGRLVG